MKIFYKTIAFIGPCVILILLQILPFPAIADRFDELWIQTWSTKDTPAYFPEINDTRVSADWLNDRPSFGIAFSGGGTRSATATLGQLRALTQLGWIDKARYMTANSGGSWTLLPYYYLPENFDLDVFLGLYSQPEHLSDNILKPDSDDDRLSMSSAIYRAKIITRLGAIGKGDEAYAKVIGDIFLDPFQLNNREKLFTFNDKSLASIRKANPKLKFDDFYRITRKLPYLIIVATLYVPSQSSKHPSELFLIETSPLYTGIRNEFTVTSGKNGKTETLLLGGGYLESFGYDSYEPKRRIPEKGLWQVRLEGMLSRKEFRTNKRYRYTLSDVIAMSGAAPAIALADKNVKTEIFPEFRHWAIDQNKVKQDPRLRNHAKELKHGDGGDLDNLAIMPLLTRKIENILVFINTRTAFPESADCSSIDTDVMVDDVISLFRPVGRLTNNVVINDDGSKLTNLCQQFANRKKSGEPLVHCERYSIKDNFRMAVQGDGYQPKICWVYLDRSQKWIDKLQPEGGKKTADLKSGRGEFDTFPHYQTFGEKKAHVIDLDRERVYALSNLTAWALFNSQHYLSDQMLSAHLPIPNTAAP